MAIGQTLPHEEIIETVQTRAGELSLVRDKQDDVSPLYIKLNGQVIAEKRSAYRFSTVYGVYPKEYPIYILISLTEGGSVCATKFTLVDGSSSSKPKVTKDFGNCSDAPKVAYRADSLTITFPAGSRKPNPAVYYVGPRQVWLYRDGKLRRVGGSK